MSMHLLAEHIRYFFLIILAPLPFWLVGLAVLRVTKEVPARVSLAPLLGCAFFGWLGEVAFVSGCSLKWAAALAMLVSVPVVWRARSDIVICAKPAFIFYCIYVISLAAFSINPFPALGHWSGDWFEYFRRVYCS